MGLSQLVGRGEVSSKVAARFRDADDVGGASRDRTFDRYVGSTSGDGKRLIRDEGSSTSRGAIRRGQIDAAEHQAPRRGSGFTNPMKDWGASDFGQLNARANKRDFPAESKVKKQNADAHWLSRFTTPPGGGGTEHYDTGGVLLGDPPGRKELPVVWDLTGIGGRDGKCMESSE